MNYINFPFASLFLNNKQGFTNKKKQTQTPSACFVKPDQAICSCTATLKGDPKQGMMCLAILCTRCLLTADANKGKGVNDAKAAQRQASRQDQQDRLHQKQDAALSKRTRNAKLPLAGKTPARGQSSTRAAGTSTKTCPGHDKKHTMDQMELKPDMPDVLTRNFWGTKPHWPTHCNHCSCIVFCGTKKQLCLVLSEQKRDEFGHKL